MTTIAKPRWHTYTILGLAVFFLFAPIVYVVIFSFNDSDRLTVWGGFSIRHYLRLPEEERFLDGFWNSLVIAFCASGLAVIIATSAAWALRKRTKFHRLLGFLTTAPLVMPEVIIGISLLLLFILAQQVIGFPSNRGLFTIVLAHATFAVAFVTLVVSARLQAMDPACEEAAADLGASRARVFWQIVLPQLIPALTTGWLLAFVLSFDDLIVASFTTGPGSTTLPMQVFSSVRLGFSPHINALSTLILVFLLIFTGLVIAINRKFRQR